MGIAASAVRCLQRKPDRGSGGHLHEPRTLFAIPGSVDVHFPPAQLSSAPNVRDFSPFSRFTMPPYELPDTAIEHRLRPYCTVFTRRRGKLQGYPDVYNGIRHYRVQLKDVGPVLPPVWQIPNQIVSRPPTQNVPEMRS